jgi:hypothetical protein
MKNGKYRAPTNYGRRPATKKKVDAHLGRALALLSQIETRLEELDVHHTEMLACVERMDAILAEAKTAVA